MLVGSIARQRMLHDQERVLHTQQIASQQFTNGMIAWANYMQAVNARQPQTVHLTSTSGDMVKSGVRAA